MRCRRRDPVPEEVRRAAALLERRWTLSILYASVEGAARFNEFREALGRVPPATLATRLMELVDAGVLERRVLDTRPPAVEYRLTRRGKRVEPPLRALVPRPLRWPHASASRSRAGSIRRPSGYSPPVGAASRADRI